MHITLGKTIMSLNLKYTLKNIGNISNAEIRIKPLTIIAGENSSGKTFVTKSLYAILNSIYKDHFTDELVKKFQQLDNEYREFKDSIKYLAQVDVDFNYQYISLVTQIKEVIGNLSEASFEDQIKILKENTSFFENFNKTLHDYFSSRIKLQKFKKSKQILDNIVQFLGDFNYVLNNRQITIINQINASLDSGFKKNYQITDLKNLINRNGKDSLSVEIEEIGKVEIDNKATIQFSFFPKGIQTVQNFKNIIFFDSPVYIKIRKALDKNDRFINMFSFSSRKYLKGYPEYIDNLYHFMDKEYIDIPDFHTISSEIENLIAGKLNVTKNGDILYTSNEGNAIPLELTAMGISNIGLIDLLLRNNVINKGSFLIMDEPEVHLHPKWQVALANILYKISESGANIMIATHSLDLLKAFETILKKNPDASNIIGINKMPFDKEISELSELEKIHIILDDLSRPFYNLYIQDI